VLEPLPVLFDDGLTRERIEIVFGAVTEAVKILPICLCHEASDLLGGPGRTRTCNQTVMSAIAGCGSERKPASKGSIDVASVGCKSCEILPGICGKHQCFARTKICLNS